MLNRLLPIASTINVGGTLFLIAKIRLVVFFASRFFASAGQLAVAHRGAGRGRRPHIKEQLLRAKKSKTDEPKQKATGRFRCHCTDLHEEAEHSSRDSNQQPQQRRRHHQQSGGGRNATQRHQKKQKARQPTQEQRGSSSSCSQQRPQ